MTSLGGVQNVVGLCFFDVAARLCSGEGPIIIIIIII